VEIRNRVPKFEDMEENSQLSTKLPFPPGEKVMVFIGPPAHGGKTKKRRRARDQG
jgi:hypothetical protein